MTPVLGQKTTSIDDITVENIRFDGNWDAQSVMHGKGFHNFLGLRYAKNVTVKNVTAGNNKGDIARITDSKNIKFYNNLVLGCGHDGLYVDRCSDVAAWHNEIKARINSGLRSKGSHNVYYHDNDIRRTHEYSPCTGPLLQVENSRANETSLNVRIENNYLGNGQGPGIWAAGLEASGKDAASNLTIKNNIIESCGQMPASVTHAVSTVCGVTIDGWNNVLVDGNRVDGCYGGGICFAPYRTTSARTDYNATVRKNTICNTKQNLAGTGGTALSNAGRYILDINENRFYNNYYDGLTGRNPLFGKETDAYMITNCSDDELRELKNNHPDKTIFKEL